MLIANVGIRGTFVANLSASYEFLAPNYDASSCKLVCKLAQQIELFYSVQETRTKGTRKQARPASFSCKSTLQICLTSHRMFNYTVR